MRKEYMFIKFKWNQDGIDEVAMTMGDYSSLMLNVIMSEELRRMVKMWRGWQ